jgi:long-subunit acyl-CoA synthetase (AMP-forming)
MISLLCHIFLNIACFSLGLIITTAYDSMPADAVNHIIKETGAKAIFTEVSASCTFFFFFLKKKMVLFI